MFGLKFRKYRSSVDTEMSYLIGFDDPFLQRMLKAYSGLDDACRAMFAEGETTLNAAVRLWTIIFSYEMERSPLLQGDSERVAAYIRNGIGDWQFDTEGAARRFLVATHLHATARDIPDDSYNIAASEIFGALKGIDRQERSVLRLQALFDELTVTP